MKIYYFGVIAGFFVAVVFIVAMNRPTMSSDWCKHEKVVQDELKSTTLFQPSGQVLVCCPFDSEWADWLEGEEYLPCPVEDVCNHYRISRSDYVGMIRLMKMRKEDSCPLYSIDSLQAWAFEKGASFISPTIAGCETAQIWGWDTVQVDAPENPPGLFFLHFNINEVISGLTIKECYQDLGDHGIGPYKKE